MTSTGTLKIAVTDLGVAARAKFGTGSRLISPFGRGLCGGVNMVGLDGRRSRTTHHVLAEMNPRKCRAVAQDLGGGGDPSRDRQGSADSILI
jgi:hypothetical protein